jgi:hypothetical protein
MRIIHGQLIVIKYTHEQGLPSTQEIPVALTQQTLPLA